MQAFVDYRLHPHGTAADRAAWMHRWSTVCLRRLRIRSSVAGPLPTSGMVVSNHLSYVDIMVYGAAMPCVFVSKSEVKSWPVFGWLATLAGTIYVDRNRRSDTFNANEDISRVMLQGLPVLVFPEGTSTGGDEVLPFYASLFEPAVMHDLPVTPAYLSYEVSGGTVSQDVAYWGDMTFFPHLLRLLRLGEIRAAVRFSESAKVFGDRKTAALETREEVLRLRATAPVIAAQ
jgi:lyso-ornithine lipid O-acyltransferase